MNVTLIGAGPSDPELLTVKAQKALDRADIILYDKLVGNAILSSLPVRAKKLNVGKSPNHPSVPQYQINQLLIDYAKSGAQVVRLKGGDPFVFGRGGEELEALAQQQIPFEVIPGVTSAIAAATYGGIPVTHRDYASSFHVITGHKKNNGALDLEFHILAQLSGTLIFMMGVSSLDAICDGLISAGKDPQTPAAIIENASTPKQRKFVNSLDTVSQIARINLVCSPAVLIIGAVCSLSEKLDWFPQGALAGKTILVTRRQSGESRFSAAIRQEGGAAIEFPCIQITNYTATASHLQKVVQNLRAYQWMVFTSRHGVFCFFSYLKTIHFDFRQLAHLKFAAVGSETAKELAQSGFYADCVPTEYSGNALAQQLLQMQPQNHGDRYLLLRAQNASSDLPMQLRDRGALVEDIPIYQTEPIQQDTDILHKLLDSREIDWITFTSCSAIENFVQLANRNDWQSFQCVCIGRKTGAFAEKYGFRAEISDECTIQSMVEKLKELAKK